MQIALCARADGLLEPMYDTGITWIKERQGKLIHADVANNTRSELQNRYLNGWIYKNAVKSLHDAGYSIYGMMYTRDRFHAACQQLFLVQEEIQRPNGSIIYIFESTANMSKKRFTEYINEQVREFLRHDFKIEIPDPNEGYWLDVYREVFTKSGD